MSGTISSRRAFLGRAAGAAGGGMAFAAVGGLAAPALRCSAAELSRQLSGLAGTPEETARDEHYWAPVQQAFTIDRSVVNFNNGGVSPAPREAQEAMRRHLDHANQMPPPVALWQEQQVRAEAVRQRLARQFAVDSEEIALTRNASEGLQILQFGLDLQPGDEVLCTSHDYPRMINTFRQREKREGIRLMQFDIPVPAEDPDEIVGLYEEHITPKTKMILASHVVFLTGQILPVKRIAALGRMHGIPVIIDGAHALAHFDFTIGELDCDFYATSLHKWLFAPVGTGLLYVRKGRIKDVWPLMAAGEGQEADIRKFEEIGTHPEAATLATAEALNLHQAIGPANKAARLRYLRERWVERLAAHDRVRLLTSRRPEHACGIATFAIEGMDMAALQGHLWRGHRILTTTMPVPMPGGGEPLLGIRVSPSVYTTLEEIDRFCDIVERALREGLPA